MLVLGIDPGTTRAGYGVVSCQGGAFFYVSSGIMRVSGEEHGARLASLREEIVRLIREHPIHAAGIERLFFLKNKKTGIAVAEARGVLLSTIHEMGIAVSEISPTEVKSSLTGDGHATKRAVSKMVGYFLRCDTSSFLDDVTDALAVAIAVSPMFRDLNPVTPRHDGSNGVKYGERL